MKAINYIKSFFTKEAASPANYFNFRNTSGGNWPRSWWQTDRQKPQPGEFGPVFACIQILSQEIAKLPIYHYKKNPDGSREVIKNSSINRLFKEPNKYQTRADFWLYMINSLLYEGNGYAVAQRNRRQEITSLYPLPPKSCYPHIEPYTGDVFYRLGSDSTTTIKPDDIGNAVPARNILHLRTFTPKHPLIGETPITAAAASSALGQAIERNGAFFFTNMSRPSGVLRVPGKIGPDARTRLKTTWKEQTAGEAHGEIGVLSDGAEWQQITMSAQDAEIVLQKKMSIEDIARVFRIPLYMLGDMEKTSFTNVESLNRFFYSGVLSFYLEYIEAALNLLFNVREGEFIQFDFEVNLRTTYKERIEALAIGTAGGIYKIDEARARENLGKIDGGNNVFIQQQMQTVKDRAENKPLDSTPPPEPKAPEPEPTEDEIKAIQVMIEKAVKNEFTK